MQVELLPGVATANQLGEGLLWHPVRQSLWWVDIDRHRIFEWRGADADLREWSFDQPVTALVPTPDIRLLIVQAHGIQRFCPDTGALHAFACPPEHDPITQRFNDAKCDPQGRLWVGSLRFDGEPGHARLYRIDPDGSTHVMLEGVHLGNGLAWNAAGDTLYFVDSLKRTVQAFAFDGATGTIDAGRVALDLADHPGVPDGCTIDVEDHLWLAHWDGGVLTRRDLTTGTLLARVEIPAPKVTNATFGGPDLATLYITTAADAPDTPGGPAPLGGRVFQGRPGVSGHPAKSFGSPKIR